MGLKHYGDDWRKDRRIMHQRLRQEQTPALFPVQLARTKKLLHDLLNEEQKFERHFQVSVLRFIRYECLLNPSI